MDGQRLHAKALICAQTLCRCCEEAKKTTNGDLESEILSALHI